MHVDSFRTRVESAYGVCNQRFKLQYDELLSTVAFKFKLRRYNQAEYIGEMSGNATKAGGLLRTSTPPTLNSVLLLRASVDYAHSL